MEYGAHGVETMLARKRDGTYYAFVGNVKYREVSDLKSAAQSFYNALCREKGDDSSLTPLLRDFYYQTLRIGFPQVQKIVERHKIKVKLASMFSYNK